MNAREDALRLVPPLALLAPNFVSPGARMAFPCEPLRSAVKDIMFSGRQRQYGTVRDVLPADLHKNFSGVLDTPVYLRDDPAAEQVMHEEPSTHAWYGPDSHPETGERLGTGSIHITSEAPLQDRDFTNLVMEEILHAARDAKMRPDDYYRAGQPVPYEDQLHEQTAKRGADYYTTWLLGPETE